MLLLLACPAENKSKAPVPPPGLAGVGEKPKTPETQLPAGHPPVSNPATDAPQPKTALSHGNAPKAPQALEKTIQGTVLEVFSANNYTYLKVKDSEGNEQWAAVLTLEAKKGDAVEIKQQMVMENFQSKSLNRNFDKIIFGTATKKP